MNNSPELPKKLYKYRTFDKVSYKSLLKNNELFFSSPDKFNDPFDCDANFSYSEENIKVWENLLYKLPDFSVQELLNDEIYLANKAVWWENNLRLDNVVKANAQRNLGVFSLAEEYDNILMWSHYSDCHKGFCIEFNIGNIIKTIIKLKILNVHINIGQAKYSLNYPLIKNLSDENDILKPFFVKHPNWKYEKEWRLIYWGHPNQNVKFDDNIISAIYFGLECPKENIDEAWELVKDKTKKPIFYKMKKSFSQFALEYEELKQYR